MLKYSDKSPYKSMTGLEFCKANQTGEFYILLDSLHQFPNKIELWLACLLFDFGFYNLGWSDRFHSLHETV